MDGVVDGEKKYYVVENGGGGGPKMLGYITLKTFKDAFEDKTNNHKYFLVAPPKEPDDNGNLVSAREKVAMRAMGSIGVVYRYSLKSVNCEAFASALYRVRVGRAWNPVQTEVIKGHFGEQIMEWWNAEENTERRENYIQDFLKNLQRSQDNFEGWRLQQNLMTIEAVWERLLKKKENAARYNQNLGFQWWMVAHVDIII